MKATLSFRLVIIVTLLAALFGPAATSVMAVEGSTFTVNGLGDGSDEFPWDGICATSTGKCTLRAAIESANLDWLTDAILFDLPGTGMHTIQLASALPPIAQPVVINATTQPGCQVPCVRIDGAALPSGSIGFHLAGNSIILKGFVITNFGSAFGVYITGDNNTLRSNEIGFLRGSSEAYSNGTGVNILGNGNRVAQNIITGNTYEGIILGTNPYLTTDGNLIQGNRIGPRPDGVSTLGNGRNGIYIGPYATHTLVGGTTAGLRNVISANGFAGIDLRGDSSMIRGNYIGTGGDGNSNLGNGTFGIYLFTSAENNMIGGGTSAQQNRIAHNKSSGILSASLSPNSFRGNSIFHNGGLGIDLYPIGVIANDLQDWDFGPNGFQNYPVLTAAWSTTRVIRGTLNSTPGSTYTLDFFSTPGCDPSGHGEGKLHLGSRSVTTDANGDVAFRFVTVTVFSAGSFITATATDSLGNTSEFSQCKTAVQ